MVPQQNAAFSVQATYCLNAKFVTRAMYDESSEFCSQGAQPTRMQVNQAMQATACPLYPRERQGPRRSLKVAKPPDQDFAREGHHTHLSGVA